jgi:hypothetical protein
MFSDKIAEDEMGGACRAYGGEEKYIRVSLGKLKVRGHLQDLGVDENTIKMNLRKLTREGAGCFSLSQDKGMLYVMYLAGSIKYRVFLE